MTLPHCTTAYFAAFAHEQITRLKAILDNLIGCEAHLP